MIHFRHLLFAFDQGSKAAREIFNVDGDSAVAERTAPDWFVKFINGKRTGRENGIVPHCNTEASSLDGKEGESVDSVCFQWQQELASYNIYQLTCSSPATHER
ncbi:hypothetical protein TNIN_281721 [Trichonephila inaurata madagascariensis]|uniref:Mos1 transposase HTH domain-containing protein n=1 Tax=Trichonephila inaurata madagascariensis TaxID=2747483 RepID=A0A8X6YQJ5_9ARAC|nr:hypothetical protein TNIN_281721 [Trichonephila inaurata madagascariensis]